MVLSDPAVESEYGDADLPTSGTGASLSQSSLPNGIVV
jgi:hypothetical protein